ncbi:hypothetical protein [Saccharothrix sp. HUAS TT1]|uniref:hypothetical protein n=1 Tax=unclassified Saccharothrix TaxID=2593673 RepID=UPI00345C141D
MTRARRYLEARGFTVGDVGAAESYEPGVPTRRTPAHHRRVPAARVGGRVGTPSS